MTKISFINQSKLKHLRGFTLIELLVTATIIIVLTTIGLISYNQALQSGRNAKRKADLEVTRQALILYKADNGYYPSTNYSGLAAALGTGYIATLPVDPKYNQGADFVYTYTPGSCSGASPVKCQAFTLTAALEVNGGTTTPYSITNP